MASDRWIEIESSEKLAKLKPLLHEHDPRILQTMEDLAAAYLNQGKYVQAEELFLKLAAIREITEGIDSTGYLWTQLDLSGALASLDRYAEANRVLRSVERAILSRFKASHPIILEFLYTKVRVADGMGDTQGDENCSRELLQISLGAFGIRHPDTLHAIKSLAGALKRKGSTAESEKLLRIVVQISNEITDHWSVTALEAMWILSEVLSRHDQHIESVRVSRLAVGCAEMRLGPDNMITARCSRQLALALRRLGHLGESEQVLKEMIENQSVTLGEEHVETIMSFCYLGETLYEDGRYEEAIPYFQKALWGHLQSTLEPTEQSKNIFHWLGSCYERLCDNGGARAVYIHYIDQFRTTAGEAHPYIIKVREWISGLPEPFNAPYQD
jgi:tetratricopeptide (TPR) repeat protein